MSRHVHLVSQLAAIALLNPASESPVALVIDQNGSTPAPAEGKRRVTLREAFDIHSGCDGLISRRLESKDNHKKIVLLQREFETGHKLREQLRGKVIEEHPCPEGWESESLPVGINEARLHELLEIDEMTIDVRDIPKSERITDKDMPKLVKGELGDQNQVGIGEIIKRLHWVYAGFPEDEKIEEGKDGTSAEE